jgi:hypothetical protein
MKVLFLQTPCHAHVAKVTASAVTIRRTRVAKRNAHL